ncbi:hypothetical protein [Jidongwangia harbinensis]|uniref:hypothetical protein n=1 Tax=Jidongwangia harbinensis TaxID=2878561 RepID=UPI001CDA29CC|nr:hypothetical protein [Jidongwangia harbinensis]MCA2214344.1 hypothetical protein [Jidongwangia harbinensis]
MPLVARYDCDGGGFPVLRGSVLRVAQKFLGAMAALLIVPIAINVGTGGTPPPWLAPLADWVWPVAVVCVLVIVALEVIEQRGSRGEAISTRHPNDPRNIDRALDQVARYIDLRQRNSFAEKVRIALSLDERPDAVRQPAHLVQRIDAGTFQVSEAGDIGAVFEELSGSMLILGGPGAGKTTQLLDLAERLIADGRAQRRRSPDNEPPVPVVVDLTDWSRPRTRRRWLPSRTRSSDPQPMSLWLGTTLRERYGIPAMVSATWLAEDRLVLLLDGLDEVSERDRERCVEEINELQRAVTRLAVCSRTADYDSLRGRLRLQGAVEIQPFRREQVVAFLHAISPQLNGVAEALSGDKELWEMLTTPLMLNVMALAYGEKSARLVPHDGNPETRRKLLFDAYVIEVLARHRARTWSLSTERTLLALRALAHISTATNSGVQVARPSVQALDAGLDDAQKRIQAGWLTVAPAFTGAIALAAVIAQKTGMVIGLLAGAAACFLGMLFLTNAQLVASPNRMTTARYLLLFAWSVFIGTVLYLELWVLLELMPADWEVSSNFWLTGLIGFLAFVSWTTLVYGPMTTDRDIPVGRAPLALVIQALLSAPGVIIASAFWPLPAFIGLWPTLSAVIGIVVGWVIGMALSQTTLASLTRFVLVFAGEPDPWRPGLLQFAADRSLLSFVDTEYRFVHLLVRDHLAVCDPALLASTVTTRRDELARRT